MLFSFEDYVLPLGITVAVNGAGEDCIAVHPSSLSFWNNPHQQPRARRPNQGRYALFFLTAIWGGGSLCRRSALTTLIIGAQRAWRNGEEQRLILTFSCTARGSAFVGVVRERANPPVRMPGP